MFQLKCKEKFGKQGCPQVEKVLSLELVAYMVAQGSTRPVHVLGTGLNQSGGPRGSLLGGTVLGGGHGTGQILPQPG